MMLPKVLEQISLADLQTLVAERAQEGKAIEYKGAMYQFDAANQEYRVKQHQEFLKDVSSFANTVGGDLIVGIEEHNGVPVAVSGVDASDPDALKLRMLQLLESWVEPRVGCSIHFVPVTSGKFAFVIRIPRSILSPHRVIYSNEFGQFWGRNSGGAFAMDTTQLRHAFTLTETTFDKIAQFRRDRVEAIAAGQTPILMPAGPKMILHLVPLESFAGRLAFTPSELSAAFSQVCTLAFGRGASTRINLDGIVRSEHADLRAASSGSVQVFRNGIVEVIAGDITFTFPTDSANTPYLRTHHENYLKERLPEYLNAQQALGIPLPIWCFLTLTGVKGVHIHLAGNYNPMPPMDRDVLWLPEVEIEDYTANPLDALRPLFDMTWNSAGYPRCLSFNEQGEWCNQA